MVSGSPSLVRTGTVTVVPVVVPRRVSSTRPSPTPEGTVTLTEAVPTSSNGTVRSVLETGKVPSTLPSSSTSICVSCSSPAPVIASEDTSKASVSPAAYAAGAAAGKATPTACWR